jgi:hypothetical protein
MHHTMLVLCVVYATAARRIRKDVTALDSGFDCALEAISFYRAFVRRWRRQVISRAQWTIRVRASSPSHAAASVRQDKTLWPSMMTVQAPHAS